jgi:flagella basal body P-ring formation protein FlgA
MMTNRCLPPLVLLLFCIFCSGATTQTLTLDRAELEALFTDIQLADSPWPARDLVVSDFSSSPSRLTVPAGRLDHELLTQNHGHYLGQQSIAVLIKVDGEQVGKVRMRGTLELYGDVVILNRRLARRDIISAEDLSVARRNITMFSHELVTSPQEAVGRIAKTSLSPGTVLLSQYLENPPLVQRGDLVTITAGTPSVQVSTKGEARSQGAAGDLIQVRNLSSRQLITAQVVDQGLVRVDF